MHTYRYESERVGRGKEHSELICQRLQGTQNEHILMKPVAFRCSCGMRSLRALNWLGAPEGLKRAYFNEIGRCSGGKNDQRLLKDPKQAHFNEIGSCPLFSWDEAPKGS